MVLVKSGYPAPRLERPLRLSDEGRVAQFILFGYLTLLTEAFIGFTLFLGLFARLGALAGFLMSLNITLSVLRAPNEWIWTYLRLTGYSLLFLSMRPGRNLGLDGFLARWLEGKVTRQGTVTRLLSLIV